MRGTAGWRMRHPQATSHVTSPGPHMCGPPVGAFAYRNISAQEPLALRLGRVRSARFFAEARQFVFVEAAFVFLQQRPRALQICENAHTALEGKSFGT